MVALDSTLVASLIALTEAFGTTAPAESVITPVSVAVSNCAMAIVVVRAIDTAHKSLRIGENILGYPPRELFASIGLPDDNQLNGL